MAPGGEVTVTWIGLRPGLPYEATGVFASTRPAGGSFPAIPEVVSATPPVPTAIPSLAAPLAGGARPSRGTRGARPAS